MDDQKTPPSTTDFLNSLREKSGVAVLEKDAPMAPTTGDTSAAPAAAAVETPQPVTHSKLQVAVKALRGMERNIATIIRLLEAESPASAAMPGSMAAIEPTDLSMLREMELAGIRHLDGRVVEGVFDGVHMIGSDGKSYAVPPNYASKSKLVEGDMLKLTITPKGTFIYKQIGPIDRNNLVATLGFDATNGDYYATAGDKRWSLLKASITFFKGEPGDEVALLVPKNAPSKWAAVENIIKKAATGE